MHKKFIVTVAALLALVLLASVAGCAAQPTTPSGTPAPTGQVFKWRAQTYAVTGTPAYQAQLDSLAMLKKITDGRLDVQLFPAAAIVGYDQMLDALKAGTYEVGFNAAAFFEGTDPGFAILFNLPGIWENIFDVNVWADQYGGNQLFADAYAPYNIHYVNIVVAGGEPFMSKKPVRTLADIKGLKVRGAPGLEQGIWNIFGASTVDLPGSEIYTALQTGLIDGAAYITASDDYAIGMHEVTKYILYPSIHCPTSQVDISVNNDAWKKLPPDLQAAFEAATRYANEHYAYLATRADIEAIAKMQAAGVEWVKLSAADMATARDKASALAIEWAKKSPLAQKVVDSVFSYLKAIGKMK